MTRQNIRPQNPAPYLVIARPRVGGGTFHVERGRLHRHRHHRSMSRNIPETVPLRKLHSFVLVVANCSLLLHRGVMVVVDGVWREWRRRKLHGQVLQLGQLELFVGQLCRVSAQLVQFTLLRLSNVFLQWRELTRYRVLAIAFNSTVHPHSIVQEGNFQ